MVNPYIAAVLLGALMGSLLTAAIITGYRAMKTRGKSLAFFLPEIPGTVAEARWVKTTDGKIDRPSQEHDSLRGEKDSILPAGPAAYQLRGAIRAPLHLITTYGANLIAPSKLEAAESIEKEVVADWVAEWNRVPRDDKDKANFAKAYTEAKAKAEQIATRFKIWDPLRYWKACRENDMQDLYKANGGNADPWYAKGAFIAIIFVLVIILALFGFVGVKVMPLVKAAAAGGEAMLHLLWWL